MSVEIRPYGTTQSGQEVNEVILKNETIEAHMITYGATVTQLLVPDKNGNFVDVALGYGRLEDYEHNAAYLGATVGRNANRISGSHVQIDGVEYALTPNEGENQLHGGPDGFSYRVFDVELAGDDGVIFHLVSPDGDQGYPGNLELWVICTLGRGRLSMRWRAQTDKPTLCNITNHTYYNLNGHNAAGAIGQRLRIEADRFTPVNKQNIPQGRHQAVAGTPMDFIGWRAPAQDLFASFAQLRQAHGYDHNFVLKGEGMRRAASMVGTATGIRMDLFTDQPGLQLYTAGFLTGPAGKDGACYTKYSGIALEPQAFPDTANRPEFGSVVLRPGEVYDRRMRLEFSLSKGIR